MINQIEKDSPTTACTDGQTDWPFDSRASFHMHPSTLKPQSR